MDEKPTYKDLEQKVKDLESRLLVHEGNNIVNENLFADVRLEDIITALMGHTSDYILICDKHGTPQVFNKAYATVIKEALNIDMKPGIRPHEFLDDPEAVKYWDQLRNRALEGDRFRAEYTHEFAQDDIRSFEVSYTPIESNGQIKGFVELTRDITDLRRREETLRESEEKFRMIYTHSSDGIIVADPETKDFLYANPAICNILGYAEEELTQMGVTDIHPKDSLEHVASEFDAQAKGEKLLAMNIPFLKKNGEIVYMDTNASIVRIGGKRRLMGVFRDITDRKKAEEALKKAHDELEMRVEERTEELKIKTKSLEELNTAMKVLLEKRKEDKIKLEDNVISNVEELIEPMIMSLEETKLNAHQKMLLSIVASNLDEITSNFTRKLSMKHLNLTPTEMKIANLIKHGTTTKEIAKMMKSSPRTIETHRKNIREKVGLKQNRRNLRSYLLSLH